MRRATLALVLFTALLSACKKTQPGDPCETDAQCGSGFDCYKNVCVRVCTATSQCDPGDVCERYLCRPSAAAPARDASGAGPRAGSAAVPQAATSANAPVPDVVGIELRAIRRELELLRDEQTKLRALLEAERSSKK